MKKYIWDFLDLITKKGGNVPKPENHYILEYTLTLLRSDERGICSSKTKLAESCCKVSKEEAAGFVDFVVRNNLNELHKTKATIKYDNG